MGSDADKKNYKLLKKDEKGVNLSIYRKEYVMRTIYRVCLAFILLSGLFFAGCRPADYSEVSDEDIQGLKDYVLTSYYMLKGEQDLSSGSVGRATVPVHNTDLLTDVAFSETSGSLSDYPEKGQTTSWTVDSQGDSIYKINSTTQYANRDAIDHTEEIYYVKDENGDGQWTKDDPLVKPDGTVDNLYREKFVTVFDTGDIRYVVIDENTTQGDLDGETVKYKAFEIDGSLEFPEGDWAPTEDDTAQYSSKVTYQQEVSKRFLFWNVMNKVIVGARYYTEHDDGSGLVQTSVSYERGVEYDRRDLGGAYIRDLIRELFKPGSGSYSSRVEPTLSETVIRYKIDPDGNKTIRQKTVVVNDFGDDFQLAASGGEPEIEPVSAAE